MVSAPCFLCRQETVERVTVPEHAMPIPLHARCALKLASCLLASLSGQVPALPSRPDPIRLTPRERTVVDGLVRGDTTLQMARGLGLSERTVKNVVSDVLSKLGARTRAQAAAIAVHAHLSHIPEGDGDWL